MVLLKDNYAFTIFPWIVSIAIVPFSDKKPSLSNVYIVITSYDYLKLPYQEVYSTNYVEDGLKILNYIKLNPNIFMNKISYVEYHPFFQFYGNSTIFYYNCGGEHIPILYLYEKEQLVMYWYTF